MRRPRAAFRDRINRTKNLIKHSVTFADFRELAEGHSLNGGGQHVLTDLCHGFV
jgi:hypothetical protein